MSAPDGGCSPFSRLVDLSMPFAATRPSCTATPRATRASTMTIQAGEIWLADIPFTNAAASKKRPVLVLWLDGLDAVVAVVTSAAPRTTTDVPITDWQTAKLKLASTVRLSDLIV